MLPKVVIVYLSYHADAHLNDAVNGWRHLAYDHAQIEIVIVDNPHPNFGSSVPVLEERVMPFSGIEIPHVTLLPQEKNLGFAGGNNVGMRWAIEHGFTYIFLHNDDGIMAPDCLGSLVSALEQDRTIGAAQSLMLLYPETSLVNSSGNIFHYLGFGFCGDYRKKVSELALPAIKDTSYASGGAILLRTDLLQRYGLWDEDFFMYHEDLEYSFRLRMAGFRTVVVRDAVFYHKYQFGRSIQKFYWMERNRFGVLLMFFRWPTLILLLPMLVLMELGQWIFAMKRGWIKERMQLYQYWCKRSSWQLWMKKRKYVQSLRHIRDRDLLINASPKIQFQEEAMRQPLLTYVGNPLMAMYYWIVVWSLIHW